MARNCICVKWGTRYPSAEVNALFASIRRQSASDFRFLCLTDDPEGLDHGIDALPLEEGGLQATIAERQARLRRSAGALRKIAVFRPGLVPDLDGPLLCLDIDVLVTGPIDALFDFAPGKVCMPPPFKKKSHIETRGEGSVIRFDPGAHPFLYDEMANDTEAHLEFSMGSEQRYTSFTADRHGALAHYPADWIVSYTRHCRPPVPLNLIAAPKRPEGAKIVCFPSEPKARDAVNGWRAGLKSIRPAPWIADYL